MTSESNKRALLAALVFPAVCGSLVGCNTQVKDDEVRYNELDRLRVLALRTDPADVAVGDTATLSALVFEPEGRVVRYAWSWCPAPGGAEDGFECLVGEQQARDAWATLGTGTELAPFDLGAGETAELPIAFDSDLLSAWCGALYESEASNESLLLACVLGLKPRIQLTVATDEDELVSLRELPLADAKDPTQRNQHPTFNGEIEARTEGDDRVLEPGEPFRPDVRYTIRVGIDEDQAERTDKGDREELLMTWFVTPGDTREESEGERTTFIEGTNEFEDLLENSWLMPAKPRTSQARLFLVLRDDRGGVSWAEHRFEIREAE